MFFRDKKKRKLKKVKSTQSFIPIRDIRDGIIITSDGGYVKIMEFSPINFGLRSPAEQEAIISQFASALRSMPDTVQFKVVSRRTNTRKFLSKIDQEMAVETEPGCKKLQRELRDMIEYTSATQGVSRRFFVIFRYEEPLGFKKRPTFREIASELDREAKSIQAALEQCGNEMVSIDHDDEYILSVLYNIICRSESEYNSFDDRQTDVIARYASNPNIDFSNNIVIPVKDFIAPNAIDTSSSPNYMIVDDTYYMFCYLPANAYPLRAYGGWLVLLINMGEGVDVDFWFHKEDVANIQRKLQYKLRYNKVKMRDTEDTSQDYDDLLSAIESGYYLKQGMASNEDFCYFSTMVTITAKSLEELNYKYSEIKRHCLRQSMKIKQCTFQQADAFKATLPLCEYNKGIWTKSKRNILTSSLAAAYPFVSYEIADEDGILIGSNQDNGSLVFVDIFDTTKYNNANVAILGSTGMGKTYTLQCMALRLREKQTQVFIIAPRKGMEFERACRAIGGTFITIAPGSGNNINIMEIRKRDDAAEQTLNRGSEIQKSYLMQKVQQLHTFFSLLIPDITPEERQILDEALLETYGRFGITSRNKSLWDSQRPGKYKRMPILGDLHDTLRIQMEKNPTASRLYNTLTRYVTGSARSFNQQTNVDLENKYIVLDVSTLSDEMLPIGMFIALDYVWDKARENCIKKKCIFIDETWKLIGTNSSRLAANFVLDIFKTIRGYGGSAICATQDINDFFALDDGAYGIGITNNAKTKILMGTVAKEAETLAKVMDLTDSEKNDIKKLKRGTCLLAANSNHVFVKVKATEGEHRLITTDRTDLSKYAQENTDRVEI